MKHRIALTAAALAALLPLAAGPASASPGKASLKIFLIAGQSNAQGYGSPIPANELPIRNVVNVTPGMPSASVDPLAPGGRVGFGRALGAYLVERGYRVGILECAVGGVYLSQWEPGTPLFERCAGFARTVIRKYGPGAIVGVVWDQGEADSQDQQLAETWRQRFLPVAVGLRALTGNKQTPLIVAQTGDIPDGILPFVATVRDQQAQLDEPGVAVVSTMDIPRLNHDFVHFTPSGYWTLGERIARAWLMVKHGLARPGTVVGPASTSGG